jgi:hypothetical protein
MTIETPSKSASTENRLAARQWVDAFNARPFRGLPPTGRKVRFSGLEISRMVDGKAAEHWFQMDTLTMFEQLGLRVVPGPRLLARLTIAPLMRLSKTWRR